MKAMLTDDQTLVYNTMEDQAISIATIHKGEVMELGKVIRKKGKVWVEITLTGEQTGYISGDTKIFAIKKGTLMANSVDLLETPSKSANVVKTEKRGTVMELNGVEKNEEGGWFKVLDDTGTSGYISSDTKMRQVVVPTRSSAIRNMVYGGLFIVLGVVFTIMNQKAAANSGMVYISIAVIFFGLLQGGQGVVELLKVRKNDNQAKK
jgi:hypothetical protein